MTPTLHSPSSPVSGFRSPVSCLLFLLVSQACAESPRYLAPAQALEVNASDGAASTAMASITLPIRLETPGELADREALAADLGLTAADVPFVREESLSVSIEWTLKNLTDEPGEARLAVNGANEWFAFDPELFEIDDEEEGASALAGDIPMLIDPAATRSGLLREDRMREAAIDLELITRGGVNAIAAVIDVNEDIESLTLAGGATVPASLFAGMVRFDLAFSADRHMVLEYAVRVRDHDDLLHPDLLAADPAELTAFMPADFVPPPPPEEM
jgi:hypothetical protein